MAGKRLKKLSGLQHFGQLLELLQIFQLLAQADQATLLHAKPIAHGYNLKEQQRLKRLDRFIEENFRRKLEMQKIVINCHIADSIRGGSYGPGVPSSVISPAGQRPGNYAGQVGLLEVVWLQ